MSTLGRASARGEQKFRADDLVLFDLGQHCKLAYSRRRRSAQLLPAAHGRVLATCAGFQSLGAHAADYCRAAGIGSSVGRIGRLRLIAGAILDRRRGASFAAKPPQQAEVERILVCLADAGLLVAESDAASSWMGLPRSCPETPAISLIGIPTRNRVSALGRALADYAANCRSFQRNNTFLIADFSDSGRTRQANRQMARSFGQANDVAIAYCGPEERASYAKLLTREGGLPPDVVNFALFNVPEWRPPGHAPWERWICTGAARNAILLDSVGELVVSVDDDTVCRVGRTPDAGSGVVVTSRWDARECWFFADHEHALASTDPQPFDFLGLHELILGRTAGSCIAKLGDGRVNVDGARNRFILSLASAPTIVKFSALGLSGDPGVSSVFGYLLLEGETWRRLTSSEKEYLVALTSRAVVQGVRSLTVSDGTFCMGGNLGLDNRDVLPPFMPVQRNQDGLFGHTVRACLPDCCFGFLPWVLEHDPPMPRTFERDPAWRDAGTVRICDLLCALIASYAVSPFSRTHEARLESLGRYLRDLASVNSTDFKEYAQLCLWQRASQLCASIDRRLCEARGRPKFWAGDLERFCASLREKCATADFGAPSDLSFLGEAPDRWDACRQLVRSFGELLLHWPSIVGVA